MLSAVRAARLTKEQSLLQYQTVVDDTLLEHTAGLLRCVAGGAANCRE